MSNGTWKRTTSDEKRRQRQVKYLFVSVQVGPKGTNLRTPKGKGRTARKQAAP
jgi:hypothetical protein